MVPTIHAVFRVAGSLLCRGPASFSRRWGEVGHCLCETGVVGGFNVKSLEYAWCAIRILNPLSFETLEHAFEIFKRENNFPEYIAISAHPVLGVILRKEKDYGERLLQL